MQNLILKKSRFDFSEQLFYFLISSDCQINAVMIFPNRLTCQTSGWFSIAYGTNNE